MMERWWEVWGWKAKRRRLREANRQQLQLRPYDLDSLIDAGHPARAIWRVLERMNLTRLYAPTA